MKGHLLDCVCVALLCAAGYAIGMRTLDDAVRSGRVPVFYHQEFAPAVLSACGYGYHNTRSLGNPPLAAFLAQKQNAFDCSALSQYPLPLKELDAFQGISRYLELSVAFIWRIRGVSWTAMQPLFGGLFAISVAATYALFRLGAGRGLALAATVIAAWSPLQLATALAQLKGQR